MLPGKRRSTLHDLCSIVLMCLCVAALLVLSPAPPPALLVPDTSAGHELIELVPGVPERHQIAGGAKEVFGIAAVAGTLLRFTIDKGDQALTTVVYGPGSEKMLEHVSEDFEVVELSLPVDVSGTYRIELQSREKADTGRTYDLKVEPLTALTPLGRTDSEARHAIATAGVLRSRWTESSLRQAIEQYDKAAVIW